MSWPGCGHAGRNSDGRAELSARHFERRAELKRAIAAPATDPDARAEAVRRLAALPRDSSPSRRRSRDMVDGRPRGVLSRFGLSRVRFRQMVHEGELPGVRKASW
ncbi:30S ribosomal protein S14 [Paractinoplanes abujensis]|nr:30S ribosomal protein S14 [Actinoplanes abujensis]